MPASNIKFTWQDKVVHDGVEQAAMCNLDTGEILLNKSWLSQFPRSVTDYTKDHESAHYIYQDPFPRDNQNLNEMLADTYADYHHQKRGYGCKSAQDALTYMLTKSQDMAGDSSNPEHDERVNEQMKRLFRYDWFVNRNPDAKTMIN